MMITLLVATTLLAQEISPAAPSTRTPKLTWVDTNGDGVLDLAMRQADGSLRFFEASSAGFVQVTGNPSLQAWTIPSSLTGCPDGVTDASNTAVCIPASSAPSLGMLLPLGNPITILSNGNVGVGTATPGSRLSVAGVVRLESGSLRFADGTTLSTATPVGPPGTTGIPGPMGPQGPTGVQGPQGPITALPSINQRTDAVVVTTAGGFHLSTLGSTITLTLEGPGCNWGSKTYSQGAICMENVTATGCSFSWQATKRTCQANGTWSSSGYPCSNPSPGPLCGY